MKPLVVAAILAALGVSSGIIADRARASVHGSLRRHFLLGALFEGVAVVPGFMVAGYLLANLMPARSPAAAMPLVAMFVLPYALGRLAAGRWGRAQAARREAALPFEHWFDLLRTSPDQAREFLNAYLTQAARDGIDTVAQLTAACASLEARRPHAPAMQNAVATLRAEIARIQQSPGQLPKR